MFVSPCLLSPSCGSSWLMIGHSGRRWIQTDVWWAGLSGAPRLLKKEHCVFCWESNWRRQGVGHLCCRKRYWKTARFEDPPPRKDIIQDSQDEPGLSTEAEFGELDVYVSTSGNERICIHEGIDPSSLFRGLFFYLPFLDPA